MEHNDITEGIPVLLNNGPEWDKHNSYSDICVLNAKDLWEPETAIQKLTDPNPREWMTQFRESKGMAIVGSLSVAFGVGTLLLPGEDPGHIGAGLSAVLVFAGLVILVAGALKWLKARHLRTLHSIKIPFTVEVVDRTDPYWAILTDMTREGPSWSEVKAEILKDSDQGKLLLSLLLQELTATAQVRAELKGNYLSDEQRSGYLEDLKLRSDHFYEVLSNVFEDYKVYAENKERHRETQDQLAREAKNASKSEAAQHAFDHLPPVAALSAF